MADSTSPMSSIAPTSRSLSRSRVSARRRPSYLSYLRWSKNMRMSPQSTETLLTIALGLGLRYIVDTVSKHSVKVTGSIVGLWEGVILLHFTKKTPKSTDPFVAFGARLFVDFVCTESIARQILVLLWMWLGMVLADVLPAIWSDKRVRRIRRRLRRNVRSLTETVPTIVTSPPVQRTIRFVPSHDLHTILEESTQASAAPSIVAPPSTVNEPQSEVQAPPAPPPTTQGETPVHAPLIAIIPVLQDAVAAIAAAQETPVIQLSDFLPPVSSPSEEAQVISPSETTPTAETYASPLPVSPPRAGTPPAAAPPQTETPQSQPEPGPTASSPAEPAEPTEPINPSSISIVVVPDIDDIEEIPAEGDQEDTLPLPAVIRQSGASTPLYGTSATERYSGAFETSPPPHYDDYDFTYTGSAHDDAALRITHSPEPEGDFGDDDNDDNQQGGRYDRDYTDTRSIPVYDINDLAEIQNESEDTTDIFIPPTFATSPTTSLPPRAEPELYAYPDDDDRGEGTSQTQSKPYESYSYVPPTPPESTTFKRRKLSHSERLPEGYFPPPRPVPRRQESKALPPVPPQDADDSDSDIYVKDEPVHAHGHGHGYGYAQASPDAAAASRTSIAAAEGWEKVDLADYAFVPPVAPAKDDESPSSYGTTSKGGAGSILFEGLSPDYPHYSEASSSHQQQWYSVPQLTSTHSQESDQELKALVHDLGPLIQ